MKRIFLETDRLILREEDQSDFSLLAPILSDSQVMYAWEHGFSDDEIRAWIERRENGYRENGFDYFLAVEKSTGEAVGQIGLLKETLDGETLTGLGWILKRSVWGKGFAFEGAFALSDYAFRTLGLAELIADIRPENRSSRNVAERIGMRKTNVVDKIVDGKIMPHIVYRMKNPLLVSTAFRLPPEDVPYPGFAKRELTKMVETDAAARRKLSETGELRKPGYRPLMEAVHNKNSLRLEKFVETFGYPVMDVAGVDAANDAWLIVQHSIGRPDFMRAALRFYESLNRYQLPSAHLAYLADRVAFYERRPQRFGTQFDYSTDGAFEPWRIDEPETLDERRRDAGLPPIETARQNLLAAGNPERIPKAEALKARVLQDQWLLKVGWCTLRDPRDHSENPAFCRSPFDDRLFR